MATIPPSCSALFALCVLTAGAPLAQEAGPIDQSALRLHPETTTAPGRSVVLPLGWRGSMPTVEVWVNGDGPFTFAIDTGGQGSARVQPELIERLGLEPVGTILGGDPSGRQAVEMPVVELEHLALGDVEFEGVRAASRPYAQIAGAPVDGILGIHLFHELILTLDYDQAELILSTPPFYPPRGARVVPLASEPNEIPMVEASLGTSAFRLAIDTGKMGGLSVTSSIFEGLEKLEEPRVLGRGRSITGPIEILGAKVADAFSLGDLSVDEPVVETIEVMPLSILGSRFLADRVLTVDQPGRRVWVREGVDDRRLAERDNAPLETRLGAPFEIPIDTSSGRPWLEVQVGDRDPERFLFDTGASVTVLDDDYARALGLEPVGRRGIGDPSSPRATEVDRFELPLLRVGDLEVAGMPALAMDLDAVFQGAPGGAPLAILGLPTFSDVLVTLDYPAGVLRVADGPLAEEGEGVVLPFERHFARGGLPEFTLRLGDRTLPTHLDSGAPGGLSLPSGLLEELPLTGEPRVLGQARTVSATFTIYRADVDLPIHLGPLALEAGGVTFMDRLQDGNLGARFLQEHVVTLDLASRRARFVDVSGDH